MGRAQRNPSRRTAARGLNDYLPSVVCSYAAIANNLDAKLLPAVGGGRGFPSSCIISDLTRNRYSYAFLVFKIPMAAFPAPVAESSLLKVVNQFSDFPRHKLGFLSWARELSKLSPELGRVLPSRSVQPLGSTPACRAPGQSSDAGQNSGFMI